MATPALIMTFVCPLFSRKSPNALKNIISVRNGPVAQNLSFDGCFAIEFFYLVHAKVGKMSLLEIGLDLEIV